MVTWLLRPCRRRPKTTLIFIVCLSLTALLAVNNRSQSLLGEPSRFVLGRLESNITPVESKHAIYQGYEDEVKTQYNTRDLYLNLSTGSQPKPSPNRKVPSPSSDRLQVFVVPFTHVDPGWLHTFESYSKETDKILNNMYQFMSKNKNMRFIWAEFVFFEKWWEKQNSTVKNIVKRLVSSGQLELASGSWVMTDEANAYFPVSIDNIVEGHNYLKKEFDRVPSMVWSNDPFGYSMSVPYLFARAGLKRTVINRIHHGMKRWLQSQRAIPFHWRQLFDKDGSNEVLTQILPYTHYDVLNSCGPNPGVCCQFDFRRMTQWGCGGQNPTNITKDNVKQKAELLVNELKKMSDMYESNVLLMMHGDDFRFELMTEWHQQHDNFMPLFEEINKGNKVKIQFGTFNDYFTELEKWYKDRKKSPAKISGDFFPYQCAMGSYWTGYFTTRPFYKRQGRLLHDALRSADILVTSSWKSLPVEKRTEYGNTLTNARRTLLLFQHHDAITGTSKKSVMKDYSQLLFKALDSVYNLVEDLNKGYQIIQKPIDYDKIASTAVLKVAPGKPITIEAFNSLPYQRQTVLTLRVSSVDVVVTQSGNLLLSQVEPLVNRGTIEHESFTLAFKVTMKPLSKSLFSLSVREDVMKRAGKGSLLAKVEIPERTFGLVVDGLPKPFKEAAAAVGAKEFGIESVRLQTRHDEDGSLKKIKSSAAVDWIPVSQRFSVYENARGGAYIMSVSSAPTNYHYETRQVIAVKGPVRQIVHVTGKDVVQHSMAVNNLLGSAGEQLHWKLLIDISKKRNFELATRFEAQMSTNTTFMYTDSVGLQLVRRDVFNGRDVAASYYPMPTAAVLDDRKLRLTIASNVEHGAMQHKKNGVEIMLDRILNQDDGKGLGSEADGIPDDMRPTEMDFVILAELVTETKRGEHLSYNSIGGHLAVLDAIYPPLVMASADGLEGSVQQLPGLVLPCEYQLVSLRKLSSSDRHLLVIHRAGVDVGGASMVNCITSGFKEAVRNYLKSLGVQKVLRTNLSGVSAIGKSSGDVDVDAVDLDVVVMDFIALSFKI